MGPATPCPQTKHLRMLLHGKVRVHEAGSVREHLEQCEVCRAIAERIEADDQVQNTLADEDTACSGHLVRPRDVSEGIRPRIGGVAEHTIELTNQPPAEPDPSGETGEWTKSGRVAKLTHELSARTPGGFRPEWGNGRVDQIWPRR